ncbi:MAG: hypothetical protein MR008_04785 [Aerococcus sp.]|nr:hypothetical protein [Aerococcus sp.]
MIETVFTVYWENKRDDVRKKHGTFKTEEDAMNGIKAWWELQKEEYDQIKTERTNSGALEIQYLANDSNYVYRIEEEPNEGTLPPTTYKLRTEKEIQSLRKKNALDDDYYLFDELAEPYRDRLIVAMNDSNKARKYAYDKRGRIIKELEL